MFLFFYTNSPIESPCILLTFSPHAFTLHTVISRVNTARSTSSANNCIHCSRKFHECIILFLGMPFFPHARPSSPSHGCPGLPWASPGFTRASLGSPGLPWVLQGSPGFSRAPSPSRLTRASQGSYCSPALSWDPQGVPGFPRVPLGCPASPGTLSIGLPPLPSNTLIEVDSDRSKLQYSASCCSIEILFVFSIVI